MNREQKAVAVGAVSGVIAMLVAVWALSKAVVPPPISDLTAERLALAHRWAIPPALLLFAMYATVGNGRFFSEAIDPTRGKESAKLVINGRVADNTTQQFLLFLVGLLGLAVTLPPHRLALVPALSITFVVMRIAFWIGYRIKPVHRAFGFAATAYMNLIMLLGSIWFWLR